MPGNFASVTLSGMLAQFVREHPAISLELDLTPRRVDLIGENFDLAIRMGALPEDSQLTARRLAVFSSSLYASPDYLSVHGEPQTPEALLGLHGLMVLSRSGDAIAWELQSADGQVQWSGVPAQRTVANSPDLLIRLARSGAGVAAVANYFAEPYVRAGELLRLLPGWHHTPSVAWAVFAGRRLMPAKTRVFLDALSGVLSTAPDVEARCVEEERRQRERQAAVAA
jgi:DNA-binding transcriptional LysR family regulator